MHGLPGLEGLSMFESLKENQELFYWLTAASAVFFVVSLIVVAVVIVRLPADHFQKQEAEGQGKGKQGKGSSAGNLAIKIGKNIVGWFLIAAGVAMLVLPGQGVLVVLIGVMLADFPGKHRLQNWIIRRKRVLRTMNWLRRKFDRPPLELDGATKGQTDSGNAQPPETLPPPHSASPDFGVPHLVRPE